MEFLEAYFPGAYDIYVNYYSPYASYWRPIQHYIFLSQSFFYRYFFPYLWPIYKLTFRLLTDTPSLLSLALLALILIISVKLLDMLRRTMLYWINMALRLMLWLVVGAVGVYVYQRGVEASVEDLGWIMGLMAGWENEGEKIGRHKATRKMNDARKVRIQRSRGPTRGGGWN